MWSKELLAKISAFLARPDVRMTEATFGRLAVNDGKFVARLRGGGGLTMATAEKVTSFIASFPSTEGDNSRVDEKHREPEKPVHAPVAGKSRGLRALTGGGR